MSSQKGNVSRNRAPKHQNSFSWHHNKNSTKTKKILSTPNDGLCQRCFEIIEWKKKYRKYKPLAAPKNCTECHEKTVTRAYWHLCDTCAKTLKVCGKCKQSTELVSDVATVEDKKLADKKYREKIQAMSERERRTFFRMLERDPNHQLSSDEDSTHDEKIKSIVEEEEEEEMRNLSECSVNNVGILDNNKDDSDNNSEEDEWPIDINSS